MWMKPAWQMYHLNSFHLRKNGRGNEWVGEGRIQKTFSLSTVELKI